MWSDFPGWPLEWIVVHDDVGAIGWAGCGKLVLLGGDIAVAPRPFDLGGVSSGSGQRCGSVPGATYFLLEWDGHEMLRSHRSMSSGRSRNTPRRAVRRLRRLSWPAGTMGCRCRHRRPMLDPSVSARAEWIEQDPAQRGVVVGVEVAAFGRVLAERASEGIPAWGEAARGRR